MFEKIVDSKSLRETNFIVQKINKQVLREAIRVTKQGGVVFAAYIISDDFLLDEGFKRGNINIARYIEKGLINPQTFAVKSEPKELFELVRKEDIDDLMSIFSVIRLHYVASDGYTSVCANQ